MNPIKAAKQFLKENLMPLRFGDVSSSLRESELRYETIADGKRNMREDLMRFGSDWKGVTKSVSENGTED